MKCGPKKGDKSQKKLNTNKPVIGKNKRKKSKTDDKVMEYRARIIAKERGISLEEAMKIAKTEKKQAVQEGNSKPQLTIHPLFLPIKENR